MEVFYLIALCFCFERTIGHIVDYEEAVKRGNVFIDTMLTDMVYENGHEYDPYVMEDKEIGFQKKILFVNITGLAKLFDGFITGLTTLHRADDCYLKENGDELQVRTDLGAGVLDLQYFGTVKFMSYGPTITVRGRVSYIEVVMVMVVNATTGVGTRLEQFYIEDIRGMDVWITGLGPLNWAVNTLISSVTSIFRRYLHNMVEQRIETHLENRMKNYTFIVDGLYSKDTESPNNQDEETKYSNYDENHIWRSGPSEILQL